MVAVTDPEPLTAIEAPVPTVIVAVVFVPVVIPEKATELVEMVLHPKPVPEVHVSALEAPEQDGTARPDGVVAVSAPSTVLAERLGRSARTIVRKLRAPVDPFGVARNSFAVWPVVPVISSRSLPVAAGFIGVIVKPTALVLLVMKFKTVWTAFETPLVSIVVLPPPPPEKQDAVHGAHGPAALPVVL